MSYTPYFIAVLIAAVFGWASWLMVIHQLSPFTSPEVSLALFFASFFVALAASFAAIIYILRSWRVRNVDHNKDVNASLREGTLISFMVCVGAVFQRLRVLTWWDAALLLVIILLVEFYFMSRE